MIILKACENKIFIKYAILFIILFGTIFLLINFKECINYHIIEEQNKEGYRTIIIKGKDYNETKTIIDNNINIIEKYNFDEDCNEFYLLMKNYKNVSEFLNNNKSVFLKVSRGDTNIEEQFIVIQNILNFVFIIAIFITLLLIGIFSVNFIVTLEKDIALFKVLGFSNSIILKFLLLIMYSFYTLLFILSIIFVNYLINLFGRQAISFLKNVMLFNRLHFKYYIEMYIFVIIIMMVSFLRIVYLVQKISPIQLVKKN